ncbi:15687_t:CDS:2 [Funneliformis mosseae]|uniref:15687_t:CDS:1 n=1 Tax=Funneliformis mosseae TaxID=27381 RepID=A0A9N8YW43_FUNMO|nr:15687_t:CDS:2 [Funneliformis mosseae]
MARLVNNFTVSCREIINNGLVKVDYISTRPENCNCDFRINLFYCKGEQIYRIATWILLIYSIILGCVSMYILYYRICKVGQSIFFQPSKRRGILRPRPQETFHLICCTYNTLQATHHLIKLFDGYSNTLWAELYLDITKLVSYALATLYPISIIYSTPTVDLTTMRWTPNKYLIDIVGFSLMIFPFIINIPIAFYTGYYADNNDIKMADYFFKLHYIMWSFWCSVLLGILLIFWYKLINILNKHMKLINNRRNRTNIEDIWKLKKLKRVVRNLTIVVFSFGSIFLLHFIFDLLRALCYKSFTVHNFELNVGSMLFAYYVIPISLNIAQFTMIYHMLRTTQESQNIATPLRVFRKSGTPDSSTVESSQVLHSSNDNITSNSIVNNECHLCDQVNESDKQLFRYEDYSNNSRFSNKYSINSITIFGQSSVSLGDMHSSSEIYITSDVFNQRDLINSNEESNIDERKPNMDDDDPCYTYNHDRKEWLAEKPKRVPLKR